MKIEIIKLLKDRYFIPNETSWDDIAKRVSNIYLPIYEHIKNMEFIPSSPTLMNYGSSKNGGTLSSCFPMGVEDSIEGIFDSIKECAIVTKMGGGVGIDVSVLRSSKETIKTIHGKSSGPLAFVGVYNETLDCIRQSGKRRGAGSITLKINHPDIIDFINSKLDLNKYNRFNFSIKVNNEFMEKLKTNPNEIAKVKLVTTGDVIDLINNNKTITIKELWDKIIYSAWKSAEPGLMFDEIALEKSPLKHLSNEVYVNPCITGDSIIKTQFGEEYIKDIVGKKRKVWSFNFDNNIFELREANKIWKTRENAEIFEIELEDGKKLKLTDNHKLYVKDKGWLELKDITENDSIMIE